MICTNYDNKSTDIPIWVLYIHESTIIVKFVTNPNGPRLILNLLSGMFYVAST